MNGFRKSIVAGVLAFGAIVGAHASPVIGLTGTGLSLVRFDTATPTLVGSPVTVTGLSANASLVGIDFRPATGQLYGISSDSQLYVINTATGVATVVTGGGFVLSGTAFGMDFNPTVDRIRVVSNTGQDLRLNPTNGAIAATDPNVAYAAGDPNAGATPSIVGSAYTNSFAGATSTTLYNIDSNLDILVTQNPPNNGTLNTVGMLGFNTDQNVGFDIFFFNNLAYASLTVGGLSGLYTINLGTGAASFVGLIGTGATIRDIALVQVPEPETVGLLGLGLVGLLVASRRRR